MKIGITLKQILAILLPIVLGPIYKLWDDETDDEKIKRKLGVIGMRGSGKTTLLHKLGGVEKVERETFIDNYEEFSYITQSGKTIYISKGKDIGGLKNYMSEYKSVVDESNVIFYFFDVNLYITNVEYRRECNSRLSFIFPLLQGKRTVLLATHLDQSNLTKSQLRDSLMQFVTDKVYSNLFNQNFFILNLTDDKQFKDLISSLFPWLNELYLQDIQTVKDDKFSKKLEQLKKNCISNLKEAISTTIKDQWESKYSKINL